MNRPNPLAAPLAGPAIRLADLDAFTLAYIECASWSSTDNGYLGENDPRNNARGAENGGDPLNDNFGAEDIAPETLAEMAKDCAEFQVANATDIAGGRVRAAREHSDAEMAGHDFWLTRNGHGAGFWDGDWPEPAATRLTEAAKAFGSCDLYVGDDGKVYGS